MKEEGVDSVVEECGAGRIKVVIVLDLHVARNVEVLEHELGAATLRRERGELREECRVGGSITGHIDVGDHP